MNRFELRWEIGEDGVWGIHGPTKPIISCVPLSVAVKWSRSQTWTNEASTAIRRDTTKRKIATGIKLGDLSWPSTQLKG